MLISLTDNFILFYCLDIENNVPASSKAIYQLSEMVPRLQQIPEDPLSGQIRIVTPKNLCKIEYTRQLPSHAAPTYVTGGTRAAPKVTTVR